VRRQENRERGSSAVESGLTLAGVAVFLTPLIFYMGLQIRQALEAPCDPAVVACADTSGGSSGGGSGGSGGSGSGDPTTALQGRVVTILGAASAVCDSQTTSTPPRGTVATCTVTYPDGRSRAYRIRWLDDVGSIRVTASGPWS
jgi:hypothetical protein